MVERLVKEYTIKAAIHNQGQEDKELPLSQSVLASLGASHQGHDRSQEEMKANASLVRGRIEDLRRT